MATNHVEEVAIDEKFQNTTYEKMDLDIEFNR